MDEKRLILFGPKLHAATRSLFRSKDQKDTKRLVDQLAELYMQHDIWDDDDIDRLVSGISVDAAERLNVQAGTTVFDALCEFVSRIIDYEGYWQPPHIAWDEKRETSDWWALREELNWHKSLVADLPATLDLITSGICVLVAPLIRDLGSRNTETAQRDLSIKTNLAHRIPALPDALDETIQYAFAEDLVEAKLFERLRDQVDRNIIVASGGDLRDPSTFRSRAILPSSSSVKEPDELVDTYLNSTPLLEFATQTVPLTIPTRTRFEHMHIVAGSGHGKSQTLQYLISNDLDAVAAGERSVVVIDSQGDLIENIKRLKQFAPGEPLHDRVVIIDPTDVEYPVSLNLFDVGQERMDAYAPLERERLQNSILELYDFVLGSLLEAGMTQKQSVIFRYVTRLMLHIQGATIHTLVELMEDDSHIKFASDIEKLSGTAKRFFETEFAGKEFTQTRKQVLRRLWGVLENQTFERMFSHPQSKLDLFSELNAGKIILINTAKDLLKENGTQIFGRFFIALIAQAAQERATLPASKRLPTFVYVDEAADYFDRNIGLILSQARKYNVGMVLAHQYLGQLDSKLQEAFAANTSIKFAGGVSAKDARALAPMLYCEPSLIERQPKGSFAAFVRGTSNVAVPLQFPFGHLEAMPKMDNAEETDLRDLMREKYAMPIAPVTHTAVNETKDGSNDGHMKIEATQKDVASKEPGYDIDPTENW